MITQQEQHDDEQQFAGVPFFQRPGADDSLGSLQYQLDNDAIIEQIAHDLKKEVQVMTPEGRLVWVKRDTSTPLINDEGLGNVISVLKSRLTKVIALSDIEQNVINSIVRDIHEDLTDDFLFNWKKYDIKDTPTGSLIISLVTDTVYATLRKGYQGNYMKLLRYTNSIQEIKQAGMQRPQQPQQQMASSSFMNIFRKR
tara:strand:+ start:4473 stop:5066 length:594 start_codon:yes stop_codon:yes gene_type:complete